MACPQKENGHLRIANEVWDKLILCDLNGAEYKLIMTIIRKTWGWNQKDANISLSELAKLTSLSMTSVTRSLHVLVGRRFLAKSHGGGRGISSKWSFNKNWEEWETVPKTVEFKNSTEKNSTRNGSETVPELGLFNTKNGIVSDCNVLKTEENQPPKNTIKDNKNIIHPPSEEKRDLAFDFFADQFEQKTGTPYMSCKGDFVQLSRLRKSFKIGTRETPPDWEVACLNFLDSPVNTYSITYMVTGNRYAIFRKSKMNQFGKPDNSPGQKTSQLANDYEKAHYNPCARG